MVSKSNVFKPFPWQVNAWRDKSFIMLLTGAAGGGKTALAAQKFHAYLLKYPGATGIVGRKDKTAANRSVVQYLLHTVMVGTVWGEYHKSDGLFQYYNGSQAWVVGMRDENQRESLRSIGKDGSVDIAWWEEANKLTLSDHQEIVARMRGTKGSFRQIIYTTNPDGPEHWIKKFLIDNKQASVHYSRPEDNPFNPPDYIESLKNLSGVYRQRLWEGLWVQAEGAVFPEFDPEIHELDYDKIKIDRTCRFILSVDFGFTNPFSCSLWMVDKSKVIYQLGQVYQTGRLVEDLSKDIIAMCRQNGITVNDIETIICDHDAEDRATLSKYLGKETKPAYKAVLPGINAMKVRLRDRTMFYRRNGLYRVDPELSRSYLPTCTTEELPGYRWSDNKQDTPIKENDHGIDENRYLVSYVDRVGSFTVNLSTGARIANYITGRM